jgi:hypothetical protein
MLTNIANPLMNINAQSQSDLVENATTKNRVREEMLDHLLNVYGFCEAHEGQYIRMDEETVAQAVRTLLQCRPSQRLLEVTPVGLHYTETKILSESPHGYRMTYAQKASVIAQAFARDELVHGFKVELHNVDPDSSKATLSISVYRLDSDPETPMVPVDVFVRWRGAF